MRRLVSVVVLAVVLGGCTPTPDWTQVVRDALSPLGY
jgi:PBP1b-binding outer membrane lipoprotein LpoB